MPIEFHRDGPWTVPEGWVWARAGDVLPIEYGKGLPERLRDGTGSVPVYGSAGIVGTHTSSMIDEPCLIIARKGSVGSVFEETRPCWPIDTVYFARQSPALFIRYAYWFIEFAKLAKLDQSTAVPSLSRDKYNDVHIAIPPLAEQRRIAERIDELLTEIADGETALNRARANLDTWHRALLKAAVTGELTREWREHNKTNQIGKDVIENIKARLHATNEALRDHRLDSMAQLDASSLPKLPDSWAWVKLGELLSLVTSGSRGWKKYYAQEGAIFVRAQNINSGILDLSDVAHVRLPAKTEGLRTKLERNDILVTITGANVTVSAVVNQDLPEAYVNQHVALLRPVEPLLSRYMLFWLQAEGGGKTQLTKAAYGAGKPGLNLNNIREVLIAVPSLPEAAEIVNYVSELLATVTDTVIATETEIADSTHLKQSLLKAAFEGHLVEQNPRDEPADVLLARLNESASQAIPASARRVRRARSPVAGAEA